ncbi:hypothetical protein GGR42_000913 [Saonia flava]|uniref:DUF3291 domain-containing protein n=1 Tax=Saonia flava TaxID=523696 RepID=A0A846QQP1_9FLAO|nr:DUF3291 domain-containing protein [Saonia flava]NJB70451.1 hypothetical protein [Saonia flava]
MKNHHLAQVNIAKMLVPLDSPIMADFVNNLDRINAIADQSEGFVWRMTGEEDNATAISVFEDKFLIINLSVWESLDTLFKYVYKSDHIEIFKRKKEWFSKISEMHMAFWYIEEGVVPTSKDAKERLLYLNQHGETPYAFTFKNKFTVEELLRYNPK